MRLLIPLLALACLFGLAALWQQGRLAELKEEQASARRAAAGREAETEVGVVREGWGVVLVGEPAGPVEPWREPLPEGAPPRPDEASVPAQPAELEPPADFELVVQPGASLSKIASAHYGTARRELLDALARYNGLASADALRSGAKLRLPPPEKLAALAESR